jgi:hypothetical protein
MVGQGGMEEWSVWREQLMGEGDVCEFVDETRFRGEDGEWMNGREAFFASILSRSGGWTMASSLVRLDQREEKSWVEPLGLATRVQSSEVASDR